METTAKIPDICPFCQKLNDPGNNFCTNCGKPLKDQALSTSLQKQIIIYAISFFLAPLGLYWGIRYSKSNDQKAKMIGIISIILTIASIIITLLLMRSIAGGINSQLNTNIDQYRELGI